LLHIAPFISTIVENFGDESEEVIFNNFTIATEPLSLLNGGRSTLKNFDDATH